MVLISMLFAVLIIGMSIPFVLRRVPPNGLYGLRVPATLADTYVWYEMNARAGRHMMHWATWLPPVAIGLRQLEPRIGQDVGETVFFFYSVTSLVFLTVWEIRQANRLLAQRRAAREGQT